MSPAQLIPYKRPCVYKEKCEDRKRGGRDRQPSTDLGERHLHDPTFLLTSSLQNSKKQFGEAGYIGQW